jgi:hypothetical protein
LFAILGRNVYHIGQNLYGPSDREDGMTEIPQGTPQMLLAHHMKTLKLPTFLREYDKLARSCAAEGVDHPRYLLRLAELELIERERRTVERRIAQYPGHRDLGVVEQNRLRNTAEKPEGFVFPVQNASVVSAG